MTLNDLKWIMNILNDPKWIFSWKTQRILWESLNDPPGSGSPQGVGRTKRHGGERFVARASEQQRSFPVSTLIFGRTGRKKWPFFWGDRMVYCQRTYEPEAWTEPHHAISLVFLGM
jgi:hypothetical protein